MACKDGACSIHHGPKTQARPVTKSHAPKHRSSHSGVSRSRVSSSASHISKQPKPLQEAAHIHHDNCGICHDHKQLKENHGISHIHEKLHKHDHSCHDHSCEHHGTPHGHIKQHDHSHGHHNEAHDHKHTHGHDHPNTLESIIAHSKLPQWLKELSLNVSFLSPALIISKLLSKAKIPQILKTLTAITGMHALNRGRTKLGRLALTYLVSGAAAGDKALAEATKNKIGLGTNMARFFATTAVAIIEKFSGDSHVNNLGEEIAAFQKNIRDLKKWKELLPSLINVESKVQIISPLINKLIQFSSRNLSAGSQNIVSTLSRILLTSAGFVGFDQILKSLSGIFGKSSVFASMTGAICGCCGSPVCAAAATDSALNNSF
ncbi:MAG: hypothetical protein O3C63_03605 [Cyanobacteria bacterium]|nr:hypothetical protein [Cyanobacteriota bacterium]MDA1021536.1 hypothetical protein [Cyanobacteriota bacterium]